jgi:drug/metabolite transporter (DMT)-like permease
MAPGRLGTLLVLGAAAMFGTLGPVSRAATDLGLDTLGFVTWRSALGGVLLLAVVLAVVAAGRSHFVDPRTLPRRALVTLAFAGLLAAVLNLAVFAAFDRTTIAIALICFYTYPVLVTLGAVAFQGEHIDVRKVAALALAMGGLLLVVLGPVLDVQGVVVNPLGIVLAFIGAFGQAAYVLVAARGFSTVPAAQATATVMLIAGAVYGVLLALSSNLRQLALPFEVPALWPWILGAAVVGAAIPSTMFIAGVRLAGSTRTAILMTAEPVVAVVLAALFLAERPVALQLVGGAAVLAAGIILQARSEPVPTAPSAAEAQPGAAAGG